MPRSTNVVVEPARAGVEHGGVLVDRRDEARVFASSAPNFFCP